MANAEDELLEPKEADPFAWDVHMEVQLFYAMAGLKPVGINKHFHMACIWEKLSNSITKEITTDHIWKQLDTLYDISILDETEALPFPNSVMDFSLPESQYNDLIKQKCREAILGEDTEEVKTPPLTTVEETSNTSASNTPKSVVKMPVSSKENTPKAGNKRELSDKSNPSSGSSSKTRKESASSLPDTPTANVTSSDKEPTGRSERADRERRRDSRDSNTSGTHTASTKTKERVKGRSSNTASEEGDSSHDGSRRGGKRHTRGATRPDETTPSSQRRRRN